MKYLKNGIFFIVAYIYFYSYNVNGSYISSYSNSTLNRITRQAKPKTCTPVQYKCKNNQCVSSTVVCDGIRNCLDGSDELWEACQSRNPNSCLLPTYWQGRNYVVNCNSNTFINIFSSSKGDFVPELTLLSWPCNSSATSTGYLQSMCLKGKWTLEPSTCIKTCDHTPKVNNTKMKCYFNNEQVDCYKNHLPGTVIRPQYDSNIVPNVKEMVCEESGEWYVEYFERFGCGTYLKQTTPPFQYPWNVAIYSHEMGFLCGGTIVGPTMVVTNANCFPKSVNENPTDYYIAVGKKKRKFHWMKVDSNAQETYTVRKVHFHPDYEAISKNRNNIALVELEEKIVYNTDVYPVCVDWDNSLEIFVKPDTIGYVANFIEEEATNTTKQGIRHITLGIKFPYESNLALYYIPSTSCLILTRSYITDDEFCVKREGDEIINDLDGGTGYFIEYQSKYYLLGVASETVAPWKRFRTFTDVLKHAGWAKQILKKDTKRQNTSQITKIDINVPETNFKDKVFTYDSLKIQCSNGDIHKKFMGGCTLPNKSVYNIDYDIKCQENIFQNYCNHSGEGAPIPQFTSLQYKCQNGFSSFGSEVSASVCFQGAWTPRISECGKICSKLKPQNVIIKCMYEGKEINCDGNLIVNTEVVMVSCLPEYRKNSTSGTGSIYCQENGRWSGTLVKCIPICGHSSRTKIIPTIHGGKPVLLGEFPWHAAVYEKPNNNTLICGASIISPYALLSAAHCFYDRNDDRERNPADYEIGVSKITRDRFTKDSETTQFYEVETLIFNNFRGLKLRYQRDIVIIVTKTKITFNSQVSPVCLFKDSNIKIESNATLAIPGWGVDESGRPTGSPILKVTHLPYISYDECIKIASASLTEYLVTEKFCSGLNVTTLDQGDSGGGLVLKNSNDFSHYLVGVLSFRATDESTITLHTYVSNYLPWIYTKLNEVHAVKNEIFD